MNKTSIDRYPPGLSRGATQGAFNFRRYLQREFNLNITVEDRIDYFIVVVRSYSERVYSNLLIKDFEELLRHLHITEAFCTGCRQGYRAAFRRLTSALSKLNIEGEDKI